tara:strand:- start:692 stop:814 length:123 start_codon:yes stop_codon:yes gene_type:complete
MLNTSLSLVLAVAVDGLAAAAGLVVTEPLEEWLLLPLASV